MRVITLPCGRPCSLGEYARSWRVLKGLPPNRSVSRWSHFPVSAGEILRDMSFGVNDRINRHLPWFGRGRKWDSDWQRATGHAARELNTPRLRIHWLPADLKERFAQRLAVD